MVRLWGDIKKEEGKKRRRILGKTLVDSSGEPGLARRLIFPRGQPLSHVGILLGASRPLGS